MEWKCGVVVKWGTGYESGEKKIHLKIDLRRFLPLSNIKYLPAFAGKIELRLYFAAAGMDCCPVRPDYRLRNNVKEFSEFELGPVTTEFTPVGEEIYCWATCGKTTGENPVTKPKQMIS